MSARDGADQLPGRTGEHKEQPSGGRAERDEAARALFRLGRLFGRLAAQPAGTGSGPPADLTRALVAEAVAAGPPEAGGEVTVGVVAERLAIDPSTASRLVAEAIRAGYLARAASGADGRRVRLALTDAGRELVAAMHRYQRAVFDEVTADWSLEEREEFARHFVHFAASLSAALARRIGAR
jgi:DNA-binding MarR family transcriptional regulator